MTLRKGLVQPQQLTLEKRLATNVINRQNGKTKLVLAKLQVLVRVLILKKTVKETTKPNVVGVDDLAIQEINVPQKRRHATNVAPLVTMEQCLGVTDPKRSEEANQERYEVRPGGYMYNIGISKLQAVEDQAGGIMGDGERRHVDRWSLGTKLFPIIHTVCVVT